MEKVVGENGAPNEVKLGDVISSAKKLTSLTTLDNNGDAILSIKDWHTNNTIQFLVSTKVLSLASPVFAKMFGPDFEEGHLLREDGLLHVKLGDDDIASMAVILKALHYHNAKELDPVDAKGLASLAIHCDKYNCRDALSPWISYWFTSLEQVTPPSEDLGFLLLAAYKFDEPKHFAAISKQAATELTPSFSTVWNSYILVELLPEIVADAITFKIQHMLSLLHSKLQRLELALRRNSTGYQMTSQICHSCGRTPPLEAKKCRPCNNSALGQRYCTGESRTAALFSVLEKGELWPSVGPFEDCSISDIVFRFTCAKNDLRHSCGAGGRCPLDTGLAALCNEAQQFKVGIESLCLSCVKRDGWDGTQKCDCEVDRQVEQGM